MKLQEEQCHETTSRNDAMKRQEGTMLCYGKSNDAMKLQKEQCFDMARRNDAMIRQEERCYETTRGTML